MRKKLTRMDRKANRIWKRIADPDYYGVRPMDPGSTWNAGVDAMIGRGKCGRVTPAPRCA